MTPIDFLYRKLVSHDFVGVNNLKNRAGRSCDVCTPGHSKTLTVGAMPTASALIGIAGPGGKVQHDIITAES